MFGKDRDDVGRAVLVDQDGVMLQPAGRMADAAIEGRLFSVASSAAVAAGIPAGWHHGGVS